MTTLPTIHLNGTGARTLLDEYTALAEAIESATTALERCTCNARDFYPQSREAWERARTERSEMFQKLEDLQGYANAWAIEAFRHKRTAYQPQP